MRHWFFCPVQADMIAMTHHVECVVILERVERVADLQIHTMRVMCAVGVTGDILAHV